jgi:serine/threonine protein kinase
VQRYKFFFSISSIYFFGASNRHRGIQHLHSLGLIYCDINPTNILMNGGTPIIGDFDSCRREGEKLGFKAGTRGWTCRRLSNQRDQSLRTSAELVR